MKFLNLASEPADSKSRSSLCTLFIAVSLICGAYFVSGTFFGGTFFGQAYKERLTRWHVVETMQSTISNICEVLCRPSGSEALPQGIARKTSELEMRPLWNNSVKDNMPKHTMSLLALAVGIKQKEVVDQIVKKFPMSDFVVMLFHYDGVVDHWKDLPWNDHTIHVTAVNQTKWWFAKRFLHPDIVAEYDYIFLWDEDLGVANFNPRRYLSIVKEEGLEISQPAFDATKSAVYHPITARQPKSRVHRRMYKFKGSGRCYHNSTSPPCVGKEKRLFYGTVNKYINVTLSMHLGGNDGTCLLKGSLVMCMAYDSGSFIVHNDLIHAWGLDFQLGYCAQGDQTKNVCVVDSEYIVHLGLLTLGVFDGTEVRQQSSFEMQVFRERWKNAVKEDKCWVGPFQQSANHTPN